MSKPLVLNLFIKQSKVAWNYFGYIIAKYNFLKNFCYKILITLEIFWVKSAIFAHIANQGNINHSRMLTIEYLLFGSLCIFYCQNRRASHLENF